MRLLFFSLSIILIALFVFKVFSSSSSAKEIINEQKPLLETELRKNGLKLGSEVFIRIFKQEEVLELWIKKDSQFQLFKSYKICTYGSEGLGPKLKEGDGKAPEGFYYVKNEQLNPNSLYHLSFNLGFPNKYDRAHGRTGSALMVHGNCVSVGCYAMTDNKIEEIYTLVHEALNNGQNFFRVHIFPFRMTARNMLKYKDSQWIDFWRNLKYGYDFFENNSQKRPPNVEVINTLYVFD